MSDISADQETTTPSLDHRKMRWWGLLAFAFATVSDKMGSSLVNTLFPSIMSAFGVAAGALGVISSIMIWARSLIPLGWAMIADRLGQKSTLVFLTGIWGLWLAAAGLAQNYTQFLILYGIGVIGLVAWEPIMNGMIVSLFEDQERGKAYGALLSLGSLVALILPPLIGQLTKVPDGWRIGMYILGGMSFLSGILIALLVKMPPPRLVEGDPNANRFQIKDIGALFKTPTFLFLAIQFLFLNTFVLITYMVTYYVKVRGWTTPQAAVLVAVFNAGFLISPFLGGVIGDFFEKYEGPNGRVILMQLYLVIFAILSFLLLQVVWNQGSLSFYALNFLTGLVAGIGYSGCILPMLAAVVEPKYAATAFALLFSFIQGVITSILLLLVGPLMNALGGLQPVMLWVFSVPLVINAIFWFVFYVVYPIDVEAVKARLSPPAAETENPSF